MSKNDKPPENSFFNNSKFNNIPICHHLPERTIYIRNRPLPLCARCTGALLGVFTLPLFHWGIIDPALLNMFLLGVPATVDATSQYLGWRESTNSLRLITGVFLGSSIAIFIIIMGQIVANYLFLINSL